MTDKCKIVDHVTFERMQLSNIGKSSSDVPRIRNTKYKRMAAANNFNLLQFVKIKGKSLGKKKKIRKRIIDTRISIIKNKGKRAENRVRKRPTRLKRSILLYRQRKREQAQLEQLLMKSENDLRSLRLNNSDEKNKMKLLPGIHSTKFREYCNCCATPDLKKYCEQLIRDINHFQRRAYAQNEIKARAHKRYVVGFRQVQAYLLINKIKLVIVATDCERHDEGDACLDETIENVKKLCTDQQVPVVFAFRRREMAYFLFKKASISCIGILDYDGARETFSKLIEALHFARNMYNTML